MGERRPPANRRARPDDRRRRRGSALCIRRVFWHRADNVRHKEHREYRRDRPGPRRTIPDRSGAHRLLVTRIATAVRWHERRGAVSEYRNTKLDRRESAATESQYAPLGAVDEGTSQSPGRVARAGPGRIVRGPLLPVQSGHLSADALTRT